MWMTVIFRWWESGEKVQYSLVVTLCDWRIRCRSWFQIIPWDDTHLGLMVTMFLYTSDLTLTRQANNIIFKSPAGNLTLTVPCPFMKNFGSLDVNLIFKSTTGMRHRPTLNRSTWGIPISYMVFPSTTLSSMRREFSTAFFRSAFRAV